MKLSMAVLLAVPLSATLLAQYKRPIYERLIGHRMNAALPTQLELGVFECPLLNKDPAKRWVSRTTNAKGEVDLGSALTARTATHQISISIGESETIAHARASFTLASYPPIGHMPRGGFFVGSGADESSHSPRELCKGSASLNARLGRRTVTVQMIQFIKYSNGSDAVLFTDAQLRNMDRLMGIMIAKLKKIPEGS